MGPFWKDFLLGWILKWILVWVETRLTVYKKQKRVKSFKMTIAFYITSCWEQSPLGRCVKIFRRVENKPNFIPIGKKNFEGKLPTTRDILGL